MAIATHCLLAISAALAAVEGASEPFVIRVVDDQTGRGVPLIELRTVNNLLFVTDSAGVVAFDEPGLMDLPVYFRIKGHGYEFPADGFGFRGKALRTTPGGSVRLEIRRINVAERLYRLTGSGIYVESVRAGLAVPIEEPLLNAQVLGSDSVQNVVDRGKLRWFWGDTNRPGYPLGNFHMPGATSTLPADGGLDPEVGVNLHYFVDENGFAKETAKMPGEGPTWLSGLAVLPDASGRERLLASYVKIRPPMNPYERGICAWDDEAERFDQVTTIPMDAPIFPDGHPFPHTSNGVDYLYFSQGYPLIRVKATAEDYLRPESYEAFTPLVAGSRLDEPQLDRGPDGRLRYGWKANTPAVGTAAQAELIKKGLMQADEGLLQLQDAETGKGVAAHNGSVFWNGHRKRWVLIVTESFGTSMLGEIWFAEADTPVGPWVYARKVVTHDNYSFYNPKQHPYFAKEGGRVIFFEGTYTHTFSGNPEPTPLYDYNQVMYKLDLDDPRLNLPVPVYVASMGPVPPRFATRMQGHQVAFFAKDRPGDGTMPVFERPVKGDLSALQAGGDPPPGPDGSPAPPRFHALPAGLDDPPATATPLLEFRRPSDGALAYTTDPGWAAPGFEGPGRPIALVWRNPSTITLPAD